MFAVYTEPLGSTAATIIGQVYAPLIKTLDEEAAPANLPAANIAIRVSLDCFRIAVPEHGSRSSWI